MKPIAAAFFFLSTLCAARFLVVAGNGQAQGESQGSNTAAAAGEVNMKLLEQACQHSPRKDLCIETLEKDPNSKGADLTGLAFVAIRLAAAMASDVDEHMRSLLIHNATTLDPTIQQALADCIEHYSDANEQLDDCVEAISTNNLEEVELWVNVAISDADLCDSSLRGEKSVIQTKNEAFRLSCNNILSIIKVLPAHK
ncbi:hypothetical protein D8674_004856 [Pyrus ussuriensis x Pyrus communis]|uniref:Pectinesterase inhibitor domain-containing protein n=1 Tax=Pyrus ussuriensis x Pyrus communis TaxID=2448454 RepID=A0A5N5FPQ9_9ROSA|nr:pectinesterase inhibitor-like [Pyrus x bretschneideri]KAB2605139.1 hypothetical protein D8674_004856 [Pyrus ussuriensis x Pyrus communis]